MFSFKMFSLFIIITLNTRLYIRHQSVLLAVSSFTSIIDGHFVYNELLHKYSTIININHDICLQYVTCDVRS